MSALDSLKSDDDVRTLNTSEGTWIVWVPPQPARHVPDIVEVWDETQDEYEVTHRGTTENSTAYELTRK
jgi:hypothetical protein